MSDDICDGFKGEGVLSDLANLKSVCPVNTSDSLQATHLKKPQEIVSNPLHHRLLLAVYVLRCILVATQNVAGVHCVSYELHTNDKLVVIMLDVSTRGSCFLS